MEQEMQYENDNLRIRFILITSKHARSGKDTVAGLIRKIHTEMVQRKIKIIGWKNFSPVIEIRFAQPLINAFKLLYGINWDKEKHLPGIRNKLIKFATFCQTEIGKDVWLKQTLKDLDLQIEQEVFVDSNNESLTIIFTDTRYQAEYDQVKELFEKLPFTNKEFVLVEIETEKTGSVTDRSLPEDSINQEANIKIFNEFKGLDDLEMVVKDKIGYMFNEYPVTRTNS